MKKGVIFALCLTLFTGTANGGTILVLAQEEIQTREIYDVETISQDETEISAVDNDKAKDSEAEYNELEVSELEHNELSQQENATATNSNAGKKDRIKKEDMNNADVAAAMEAIYADLEAQIEYIADLLDMDEDYTLIEGKDNFYEALAIYAIRHNETRNYPYEIEIAGEDDFDELQSIYWSLNSVNGAKTEEDSIIMVSQFAGKDRYTFSETEQDLLKSLKSPRNRQKVSALLED